MQNEEILNSETESTDSNYIETIKELKANSVSKTAYDKVLNENKELLKAMVDGKQIEVEDQPKISINELRANYFTPNQTNLQFWENTLALRNSLIESGEVDPFLPCGHNVSITQKDIDSAEHVAEVVQDCIDQANGNSSLFTELLQSRTADTIIKKR